jgi:hypothetical protein
MSAAELRLIAAFAKADANHDYEWSSSREAVPPAVFDLCKGLARTANDKRVVVAAAVSLPEGVFLARAFLQGFDGSYRPSYGLEVAAVRLSGPLEPELLLGVAWLATRKPWAERSSTEKDLRLELPAFDEQPAAGHEAAALRARLGLPVSAGSIAEALWLLRRRPYRFGGVVCAPKLRGDALPWNRELVHLLAVHFGEVELDADERFLLARVESRQPTEEEWQCLDLLATSRVRGLLAWGATGEGPFPAPHDTVAAAWLVAFRRSTARGARLLVQLRADLGVTSLARTVLARACAELSPAALTVLAACEAGECTEAAPDVLAELAAAGLLAAGSPLPHRAWLGTAAATPELAAAGSALLREQGLGGEAASWLLGGCPPPPAPTLEQALAALDVARTLGLPVRPAALWEVLDLLAPPIRLERLEAVAEVFSPIGPAVCAFLRTGTLAPAAPLGGADLVRAARVRARLTGAQDTPAILLELLGQDRAEEARAILVAAQSGELPRLPATLAAILAARLAGDPPVEVDSARALMAFARSGLVRPSDVMPRDDEGSILELAALWPETEPLAALLRGEARLPPAASCPAGWRAPLQRVMNQGRVASWLAGWRDGDLRAARLWLCDQLELPNAVRFLADDAEGGEAPERADVVSALDWLAALWRTDAVANRIELIARLAARGWLAGQDRLAARFSSLLLPGSEGDLQDLCIHVLSRRGPLPAVWSVAPDHLAALLPAIDPRPVLDSLFVSRRRCLAGNSPLLEALVERVRQSGAAGPTHGYTAAQLERQAPLAGRLARLPGWESCAIDLEARRRIARDVLRGLELDCPHCGGPGPERGATAAASAAADAEEVCR